MKVKRNLWRASKAAQISYVCASAHGRRARPVPVEKSSCREEKTRIGLGKHTQERYLNSRVRSWGNRSVDALKEHGSQHAVRHFYPISVPTRDLAEVARREVDCDGAPLFALRQEARDRPYPIATDFDHLLARKVPCFALLRRNGPFGLLLTGRPVGMAGGKEVERAETTEDVPQGEAQWGLLGQMVVDTEKVACTGEFCPASRRSACPGFTASPRMWETVPQGVASAGKSLVRRLVLARIVRHHLAARRVGKRSLCAAGQPALARWRKPRARKAYVRQVETDRLRCHRMEDIPRTPTERTGYSAMPTTESRGSPQLG